MQPKRDKTGDLRSEDMLRLVFDAAASAMLLVDQDGIIHAANRLSLDLFGYRGEGLIGRSIETLVPARFRDQHPRQRGGYAANPVVRAMGHGRDLFGLRRDGSEVPIEIGLNPIRNGDALLIVATIIDITERKHDEALLRASLAEKETLLREIHHRVKNNMQVVTSLLSLQSRTVDEARYRSMFEDCQARVRAMALVHEMLYASDRLTDLDVGVYVRRLAEMVMRSHAGAGDIRLETAVEPLPLDIQRAIPLGLILNELVTNAVKHAFDSHGGTVRVSLLPHGGSHVVLVVADDGNGRPPDAGTEPQRGIGLRLVAGLVGQLDGTIETTRTRGTEVRITFPSHEPVAVVDSSSQGSS